jgi:superfamily II DNA or RNA helicase
MLIPLRPYQSDAIDRLRARIAEGIRRIILVLATGAGKTLCSSAIIMMALALGNRCLFVAHRRELIKQCFCKLVRSGVPPHQIGIVMAGVPAGGSTSLFDPLNGGLSDDDIWRLFARSRPNAPVQVASVDTLRGRAKPPADLVIIDECHRSLARSYVSLRDVYPDAVFLGLTATPCRGDGRGLGEFYEHLEIVASPSMLMEQGWLVRPDIWSVPLDRVPDLSGIRVKDGDFDEDELAAVMDKQTLIGDIVDHWYRRAQGVRTIAFAVNIEHSKHIASRFREAGIPAEHVDGTMSADLRDPIFRRLETGETLLISNCDVCVEGLDAPWAKCIIAARPTESLVVHLQQVGRALRPWNNQPAIVLDHAGNMLRLGLPDEDREWTLEAKKKRRKSSSVPSSKACPSCYAVLATSVRTCPMCGHQFSTAPSERAAPEEREGELVQIPRSIGVPDDLRARWEEIVARYHRDNEKRNVPRQPGWCWHEFKQRTGATSIPPGCSLPELAPELDAKRVRFGELQRNAEANGWSKARLHAAFNSQEKAS